MGVLEEEVDAFAVAQAEGEDEGGAGADEDVFQAFWQLLHGFQCDANAAYTCETAMWPDGIDPKDGLIQAFIYAQRMQSASYKQFFDNMGVYVACNYGVDPKAPGYDPALDAYVRFSDVMCDHGLRECDPPFPTVCSV